MHLTKLELVGFKSFAKQTTMMFDRGIVSIVGPNGSGKSNTADAIRWVLGEQSIKLLRGKKSEDVIFSGSSSKARLGMAEVSIYLDNQDRQMPVDYSEVVITRRVYRNGEGEYLLNKQPIRLQDIHLLLAKSNFGQKSYSVIGQGMIDHILVASPAERKVFFDEAAGVRQYQIKREQAIAKLSETKENLSQAQMLLSEIEPHLRTLTRQVRRLERREAVKEELHEFQRKYFSLRFSGLLTDLSRHEAEAANHQNEYNRHEKELSVLQQELDTLERERSRQEVFEELQRRYSTVLEQKNSLMKERAVIEGAAELEAAKKGELNVVWLENRLRELDHSLEQLKIDITGIERDNTQDETKLSDLTHKQQKLLEELQQTEAKLLALRERVADKSGDLVHITADLRVLYEEYHAFGERFIAAASERDYERMKKEVPRFDERFSGSLDRLSAVREEMRSEEILAVQESVTAFFKTKDTLVNEIHDLARRLERRQERLQVLKETKTRLEDERNRAQRELDRLSPTAAKSRLSANQRKNIDSEIKTLDESLQGLRGEIMNFNAEEQKKKERLFELQKSFRAKQHDLTAVGSSLNTSRVEIAKLETRRDDLERETRSELPAAIAEEVIASATPQASVSETEEYLLSEINQRKHQMELIGGIDEGVTKEFQMTEERYTFLSTQVQDLDSSIESLHQVIQELDATIRSQFQKSFSAINKEFGQYFKVLFSGGTAKLVLLEAEVLARKDDEDGDTEDDEDDDAETGSAASAGRHVEKVIAGVDIIASPPNKRVSGITMLSGGERALTAIALICAILATRPSPFVVLDEVDAALDEANSQRFAAILKELAHKTQFITITHNRSTMQISSILYGVTMSDDGVSKLLSIRMEDAEKVIHQQGNRS